MSKKNNDDVSLEYRCNVSGHVLATPNKLVCTRFRSRKRALGKTKACTNCSFASIREYHAGK
jgi:hypothetical protein